MSKKSSQPDGWNIPQSYWNMLRSDSESFREIPTEHKSPNLCMEAVKSNGYNLEFVPEDLKTKEMCREALTTSPDLGYGDFVILAHIPFSDVCLEGIKHFENGLDMMDIATVLRPEVIDKELAEYLVDKDGCCLSRIPPHLQTEELALKAVSISGNEVFGYLTVREDLKTDKMYLAGMENSDYQSYLHIPERHRTPEICLVAGKLYPDLFELRPDVLPQKVKEGCNVYTLNDILEKATGMKFEVEQVKQFYEGEAMPVKSFITPEGVQKNQEVRFDKDKKEFFFKPLAVSEQKKKGLKMG
ncbi:DUF4116 domain-containing protein [Bacteroides graminisolvens]|uniref:DUF4116 domain-containing protein n=1 Tax=Bacteroides graminisolvens TaxID=477666 RepID=UPI00240A8F15|nr:DUF4116 domain-containing protein [Bacteroides graminisolvens]